MEILTKSIVLIGYLCAVIADESVTIVEGSTKQVQIGNDMVLVCQASKGVSLLLTHKIMWYFVGFDEKEILLTEMGVLKDEASPDKYEIFVDPEAPLLPAKLTVKQVDARTDGTFICRLGTVSSNQVVSEAEIDVIVVSDVKEVSLAFGHLEGSAIQHEEQNYVELQEGEYDISCTATGFSPSATVSIKLGDEVIETDDGIEQKLDEELSASEGARRYTKTVTVSSLNLLISSSRKTLICQAISSLDGATPHIASAPLNVYQLEPTIECDQNTAKPGDRYVKVICIVDHPNIDVKHFRWEIGGTGEIIYVGNVTDAFDYAKTEPVNSTATRVILELQRVNHEHFHSYYYLYVTTNSGKEFKETAGLMSTDPGSKGSSGPVAMIVVLLISLLLSI